MTALQWALAMVLVFSIGYMLGARSRAQPTTHVTASGGETSLGPDSTAAGADSLAHALREDTLTALGGPPTQQGSTDRDVPRGGVIEENALSSALGAELIVPIAGVDVTRIPDTFEAPRAGHTHFALDILAPRGTPVRSAAPGRLLKLHDSKAGGLMVYAADSTQHFVLLYGHLDHYADGLREGAPLARGQIIGYVGTTGNAPANTPHLHFAIARNDNVAEWWKGTPVDPWPLLAGLPATRASGAAIQRGTTAR